MSKKGPILIDDLISKITSTTGTANSTTQNKSQPPPENVRNAYQFISKEYKNSQTMSPCQRLDSNLNGNQTRNENLTEEAQKEPNDNLMVIKQESKWESESSSSSNVLVDFKTTTTTTTSENEKSDSGHKLSTEWCLIVCFALTEIGFTKNHLSQIAQLGKLTPTEVQDSIDAFAFDLKKNQKANGLKTSPLNFFMGILRKGTPYTPPENYESPEDEARRKYLESKRAQLSRRHAIEKEIVELNFQEWKSTLSGTQRKELAPHAKIDGSEMQNSTLLDYFLKHVYSQQKTASVEVIRRQIDQSLGIPATNEGVVSQ
jgi:hypothetical protein